MCGILLCVNETKLQLEKWPVWCHKAFWILLWCISKKSLHQGRLSVIMGIEFWFNGNVGTNFLQSSQILAAMANKIYKLYHAGHWGGSARNAGPSQKGDTVPAHSQPSWGAGGRGGNCSTWGGGYRLKRSWPGLSLVSGVVTFLKSTGFLRCLQLGNI